MKCHAASQHLVCSCNLPAISLTPQCGLCPNDRVILCLLLSGAVQYCPVLLHILVTHSVASHGVRNGQNGQTFVNLTAVSMLSPRFRTPPSASSPHSEVENLHSNRILNRWGGIWVVGWWGGVQVNVDVTFVDTSQKTIVICCKML